MKTQQFLQKIKDARMRLLNGKEQEFLDIVSKYGSDSPETAQVIDTLVPSRFQEKMRDFVKEHFQQRVLSFQSALENLLSGPKFDPDILIEMIKGHIQSDHAILEKSRSEIKSKFSPSESELLMRNIRQMADVFKNEESKQNWNLLEQAFRKEKQSIAPKEELQKRNQFYSSFQQFRQTITRSKLISVGEDKILRLFKICQNLGLDHWASEKELDQIENQVIKNQLAHHLKLIRKREPTKRYDTELRVLYKYLHEELMIDEKGMVNNLITSYYSNPKTSFETIRKEFGSSDEEIKHIQLTLSCLIQHLDEQFRHFQVDMILKFANSLPYPPTDQPPSQQIEPSNLSQVESQWRITEIEQKSPIIGANCGLLHEQPQRQSLNAELLCNSNFKYSMLFEDLEDNQYDIICANLKDCKEKMEVPQIISQRSTAIIREEHERYDHHQIFKTSSLPQQKAITELKQEESTHKPSNANDLKINSKSNQLDPEEVNKLMALLKDKNPFQIQITQKIKSLSMVIIYLSSFSIDKNNPRIMVGNHHLPALRQQIIFQKNYVNYFYIQIQHRNHKTRGDLSLVFLRLKDHYTIPISNDQTYFGSSLKMIMESQIKKSTQKIRSHLLKYSLLNLINFLFTNIQQRLRISKIFIMFKMMYEKYTNISPYQELIVDKLPTFSQIPSQLFLCFFFSLEQEKAQYMFIELVLFKKLKFQKEYLQIEMEQRYSIICPLLRRFLQRIHKLQKVFKQKFVNSQKFDEKLKKKLKQLYPKNHNEQEKMKEIIIAKIYPFEEKTDDKEKQIDVGENFKDDFQSKIDKILSKDKAGDQIYTLITGLFQIYSKGNILTQFERQLLIEEQILLKRNEKRKELRFGLKQLSKIYAKSKQLLSVSSDQLNFLNPLVLFLKENQHLPLQIISQTSQLVASMFCQPAIEEQSTILASFFHKINVSNQLLHLILTKIYKLPYKILNIFCITSIFKVLTLSSNYERISGVFMLFWLDDMIQRASSDNQHDKKNLFQQLFSGFLMRTYLKDDEINEQSLLLQLFEQTLVGYYRMQRNDLKQIIIKTLFSFIQHKFKQRQNYISFILDKISEIFGKNTIQNNYMGGKFVQANSLPQQRWQSFLWSLLKSNDENLYYLQRELRKKYTTLYPNIIKNIRNDLIFECDLLQIRKNQSKDSKQAISMNEEFGFEFKNAQDKYLKFKQSVKKCRAILQHYSSFSLMKIQLQKVQQYSVSLSTKLLSQAYNINSLHQFIFANRQQIFLLISCQFWRQRQIKNIVELQREVKFAQIQIKAIINAFNEKKMTYRDFKRYFFMPNLEQFLSLFGQKDAVKHTLVQLRDKLAPKEIQQINIYSQSVQYAYSVIKSSELEVSFESFSAFAQRIQNKEENFSVFELLEEVKTVELKLCSLFQLNIDWQKTSSLSSLLSKHEGAVALVQTYKSSQLFELIKSSVIDSRVIQDLRDYSNESEFNEQKLDVIKEFDFVCRYWQIMKKASNFIDFINKVNRFLAQSVLNLTKCIINCFAYRSVIFQNISQSQNRETSFKYNLQAIFKQSTFIISKDQQIYINVDLNREIIRESKHKMISNGIEITEGHIIKIDLKRLASYRDKSMLLYQDMIKENSDSPSFKDMIELFKKYSDFYAVLENINSLNTKMVNYGYNEILLTFQYSISDGDFSKIQDHSEKLIQQCEGWVRLIKEYYEKSYLLTHFFGRQLNCFVNHFSEGTYYPALQNILDITRQQYFDRPNNSTFKIFQKQAEKASAEQKIRLLTNAFDLNEKKFLNNFKKQNEPLSKNQRQIVLLSCRAEDIYYSLFVNDQPTRPSQILFCEKNTTFQQMQLFLNRALIFSYTRHYIIKSHLLREQVKMVFCDLLLQILRTKEKQLQQARLVFVSQVINDKLYAFLTRPNQFNFIKKEMAHAQAQIFKTDMTKKLSSALIFSSVRPGLGKTYQAVEKANQMGKQIKLFPVCGNISYQSLSRRLKELQIKKNEVIIIQIGHVQNYRELETFLAQIILFHCFYYERYVFFPSDLHIFIEMENVVPNYKENPYHILSILMAHKRYIHIQSFNLKSYRIHPKDYNTKFVLQYLSYLEKPSYIRNNQYKYLKDFLPNSQTLSLPVNWESLLDKRFVQWFKKKNIEPTFYQLQAFLKMLFPIFRTFSDMPEFQLTRLQKLPERFKKVIDVRQQFLQISVQNTLQLVEETLDSNDFSEKRADKQSLHQRIRKISMMILPSNESKNFQFVYLSDEKVKRTLKFFLLIQDPIYSDRAIKAKTNDQIDKLFKQTALNKLPQQKLQQKLLVILSSISGNKIMKEGIAQVKKKMPILNNYKLTLDNLFKMCLIVLRSQSQLPVIIMGQSGVGKTALLDFLIKHVLQEPLYICNVHAGYDEDKITDQINQFTHIALKMKEGSFKGKLWVFFDQFNTTDELSYIKQIVMDRRFQGKELPSNIAFVAACNPYRKRQSNKFIRAGIRNINHFVRNQEAELAFLVKPPPLSMIHSMWDYQQLKQIENRVYVSKILESLSYAKKDRLIQALVQVHSIFMMRELSSVSLRDVCRFKELYEWFKKFMPRASKVIDLDRQPNYGIDEDERAVILSFSFCYVLRLPTKQDKIKIVEGCERTMGFKQRYMLTVLQNEQREYVEQLKCLQQKIAMNKALMENIFVMLVCILNKIPVLLVGSPGCSKSLSIKMLSSNLRGDQSYSLFFRQFSQLIMIYYLGSESSTSQGVEQVFRKAISSRIVSQKYRIQNCILFDEIGLAEKSIHNPLKVLHAKLETNRKEIAFIGISNSELDAAKMSRFLILSRPDPDEDDLKDTAVKIYDSYSLQDPNYRQKVKELGTYYNSFINTWDKNISNRQGFFGLRDFYSCVKSVCRYLQSNPQTTLNDLDSSIAEAIRQNFDGQPGSLKLFFEVAKLKDETYKQINPVKMVQKNLKQFESRCLLLIIRSDALIPLINSRINKANKDKIIVTIHGSTFKQDQNNEQYNLQLTSLVITHVSRGNILAFKDINNSIQTSFYDLFNKSYSQVGEKRYCRIAVGAYSNPKCCVHPNFNAIVYVDEKNIKNLDLPFLNRFEKHELTLQSMATEQQIDMLRELQKWLNDLFNFSTKTPLQRENFIYNCSEESLMSLLIKLRGQTDIKSLAKEILLQNSTNDLTIYLKSNSNASIKQNLQGYLDNVKLPKNCKEDMIIFTYDQFADLCELKNVLERTKYSIRLSEIGNQKVLRRQLGKGLGNGDWTDVEIKLNYQKDYMHINLILFLAKQIKEELKSKRQIWIIIQLQRFSLHQLCIESINISYLHSFQQFFIEDLHSLTELPQLLQTNNCWQLYELLKLQEKFPLYYIDSLKLIKFESQNKQNDKNQCQRYFSECLLLPTNEIFREQARSFMKSILSKRIPDLSMIQTHTQIVMCSSNIQEALSKYIGNMAIEILFYLLRQIIDNGFLFHFIEKKALQLQPQNIRLGFDKDYEQEKQYIQSYLMNHLSSFTSRLVKEFLEVATKNPCQLMVEGNIITIDQVSLLPGNIRDFQFSLGEDFNRNIREHLQHLPLSKNLQNVQSFNEIMNTCKKTLSQNLHFLKENYNGSKFLNKAYFYDFLNYSHRKWKIITLKPDYLYKIIVHVEMLFSRLQLSDKIIFSLQDPKLALLFYDLLNLMFVQNEGYIIIEQNLTNQEDSVFGILKMVQKLFDIAANSMILRNSQLKKFKTQKEYVYFFRTIYLKKRQIIMFYNEQGLSLYEQVRITNQFLQMLEKVNLINIGIAHFLHAQSQNISIFSKIHKICRLLLKECHLSKQRDIVLNYLSLTVFCDWIMSDDQSENEKTQILTNFADLCNLYSQFANNAGFFLSIIFKNLEEINQLDQLENQYRSFQMKECLQPYINSESHFTVALCINIATHINQTMIKQKEQMANSSDYAAFVLTNYHKFFVSGIQKLYSSNLQALYVIEFSKIYGLCYLKNLLKDEHGQLNLVIDRLLCQENMAANHLRLYLMKNIYNSNKQIEDYGKRCKWIKQFSSILSSKQKQILIPCILGNSITQMELKFKKLSQKWNDGALFSQIITDSLQSNEGSYELLTLFMQYFYARICPQQKLLLLKAVLHKRNDIQYTKNVILLKLLQSYMNHKIGQDVEYTIETTSEEFQRQIPFLNYLNVIVANRQEHSPLIQMFFEGGLVPQNYKKWLDERALIGSLNHPNTTRAMFILKRHSQNRKASYYAHCLKGCDYLFAEGGNFEVEFNKKAKQCPLCEEQFKQRSLKLLTESPTIKPQEISKYLQKKLIAQQFQLCHEAQRIVTYKLFGYQNGNSIGQIAKKMNFKKDLYKRINDFEENQKDSIRSKLLYTIIYFVWLAFSEMKLIKQRDLQEIFELNATEINPFLKKASDFFYEQTNRSVGFNDNGDGIVWHLGMANILFSTLSKPHFESGGLKKIKVRNQFEQQISELIFPYIEKQKQKLLRNNRRFDSYSEKDLLQEKGNFQLNIGKYPQLRLYKLIRMNFGQSYEEIKKHYRVTLETNFPLLNFLLNEEGLELKLKCCINIFIFISQLWKIFNQQITRHASKQTLKKIMQGKKISITVDTFVSSWNKIIKDSTLNSFFSGINPISENSPLNQFFIDRLNPSLGEQTEIMLKSCVQIYNKIGDKIKYYLQIIEMQEQRQYFVVIAKLNPTSVAVDSKLLIYPSQALKETVQRFCFYSVEYGIFQPHYAFDHIQSFMTKQFYGYQYLHDDPKFFNSISYKEERIFFIGELREDLKQLTLQDSGLLRKIDDWEKKIDQNQEQRFKIIKDVQDSLENIIVIYKNFKQKIDEKISLREFLQKRVIKQISQEVMKDPIGSLPLSCLIDIYERVEELSLKTIDSMLDSTYQTEFDNEESKLMSNLILEMKKEQSCQNLPRFKHFHTAVRRLAGRYLIPKLLRSDQALATQLCQMNSYWPKKVKAAQFNHPQFINLMSKITMENMASLLRLLMRCSEEAKKVPVICASKPKGDFLPVLKSPKRHKKTY